MVNWDLEALLKVFSDDAVVEAGVLRVERESLGDLYSLFFGDEVKLAFSNQIDNGPNFVLEWKALGGPADGEAGLAVYSRDEDGLINRIRMYDNLDLAMVPGLSPAPNVPVV